MDKRKLKVTQGKLKQVLDYSPFTGVFSWSHIDRISVGHINKRGYLLIRVYGKKYYARDLAYLWMIGTWPDDEMVFYDGDRLNHAWDNLETYKIMGCEPLITHRTIKGIKKYSYLVKTPTSVIRGPYTEAIGDVKLSLNLDVKGLLEKKPAFAG